MCLSHTNGEPVKNIIAESGRPDSTALGFGFTLHRYQSSSAHNSGDWRKRSVYLF